MENQKQNRDLVTRLKQGAVVAGAVAMTALVHCEKFDNKLLVTACIDNLLKGAVGQAVQNMNIMFGIDETTGLRLKASAF